MAVLIDSIIIGGIAGILNAVFGSHQQVVSGSLSRVLALAYFIIAGSDPGATLGKMALGLRVVKLDGAPMSWSESIIRHLLRY